MKKINEKSGKILKVKYGYNPNSSSIGTVVYFAFPLALFGVTLGFSFVSSLIMSAFIKKSETENPVSKDQESKNKLKIK